MDASEARVIHLDDDACADLVLGLVDAREREAAYAHARACPMCEERLRQHVAAHEATRVVPPVHVALVPPARRPARLRGVTGIALAAALAAVFALPALLRRPAEHAALPALPVPEGLLRTREGRAYDPRFAAGLEAYRRGDLVAAERGLAAAHTEGAAEDLRRLVLARVRLERGDGPGALALLRGVDWARVPEPWRRSGAALLARALRDVGEAASADSIERALRTLDPAAPFSP